MPAKAGIQSSAALAMESRRQWLLGPALSRSKNGVASLARSRSKNGVASLAYGGDDNLLCGWHHKSVGPDGGIPPGLEL
jgi:hypothetical protein